MQPADARGRLSAAPVARMATVRPDGAPHIVPVTFAVVDDLVVTAVDHKPKSTRELARLRNIRAEPRVTFLVDHYDDDWTRLWWVRADTVATVHDIARPAWLEALAAKYRQYRDQPPEGPAVAARIEQIRGWSAQPTSS